MSTFGPKISSIGKFGLDVKSPKRRFDYLIHYHTHLERQSIYSSYGLIDHTPEERERGITIATTQRATQIL